METKLTIRQTDAPQRMAEAWFIAGDDPRTWLNELAAWRISLAGVRLYLVPRSIADRRPCGVLVLPPEGLLPEAKMRAEAYGVCCKGRSTRRLYLPLAARLDPPASPMELEAALASEVVVWHPVAGLVGFEANDALAIADLLEKPVERAGSWHLARSGGATAPRLLSVSPIASPDLEQSLDEWRDDIGSDTGDDLPAAPREPSDAPLAQLARRAKVAVARMTLKLTSLAPRTATAPNWINQLENWARGQIALFGNASDNARRKEINRLLHLLDSDPDRGLRHAIPLGGKGGRGHGPPADQLPAREIDFKLDHLGGGRPLDPWQVDNEQQLALRRRYRELANRELELGRHRRAAYIFAELLDDLTAAAGALEQGRHDREAANLYRHRLYRPLDAARCLEQCGGWEEAIEIYLEHQHVEKAAQLLTRLERFDEAAAMYRRAVEQSVERGDRLRAATLLEKNLHAPDEAIELLAAGWPTSTQAAACLAQLFDLLGRLARHEEMHRWISRLREEPHSPRQLGQAAVALAEVAKKAPERSIREQAADVVRVLVGRRLPTAGTDEAASLVRAVRLLVPQDALLGRDAARWQKRPARPPETRKITYEPAGSKLTVTETVRFHLPGGVAYKTAIAIGSGFIAAGFTRRGVAAVRASFEGDIDRVDWDTPLADLRSLLLTGDAYLPKAIIALLGGPALEPRFLRHDRSSGERLAQIGTPAWFMPETLAVAASGDGVWWSVDNELVLSVVGAGGALLGSRQFSLAELGVRAEPRDEPPERLAVMLARRGDVYLGIGHTLVAVKSDRVEQTQLNGWIRQFAAAPLALQLRLAASFEDYGAAVIWDDLNGRDLMEIVPDLERPELTFTLDGLLVAANHKAGYVYSTSNRRVALRARFAGVGRPLASALCGDQPCEFYLLTEEGEVRGYRVE
jgi:tetratricopeptide (TPR) repeat protein